MSFSTEWSVQLSCLALTSGLTGQLRSSYSFVSLCVYTGQLYSCTSVLFIYCTIVQLYKCTIHRLYTCTICVLSHLVLRTTTRITQSGDAYRFPRKSTIFTLLQSDYWQLTDSAWRDYFVTIFSCVFQFEIYVIMMIINLFKVQKSKLHFWFS